MIHMSVVLWLYSSKKPAPPAHQERLVLFSIQQTRTHPNLHKILPNLTDRLPSRLTIREETALSRLHIGHLYATHVFLLKGEGAPFCVSLEHILLFCCLDCFRLVIVKFNLVAKHPSFGACPKDHNMMGK